jgi:hypothetical protein
MTLRASPSRKRFTLPVFAAHALKTTQSPSRLSAKDNAPRPSTQASAFSFEVRAQPMNPWIWFLLSTAKQ